MKHILSIVLFFLLTFTCTLNVYAVHFPGHVDGEAGFDDASAAGESPWDAVSEGGSVVNKQIIVKNPIAADSITELFLAIIDILLVFAIPIIAFFIILAGFTYVTARGNAEAIEKAHMALLYALVGGVLILGAKVLIEVIGGTVDEIRGAFLIISSFIA